MRDIQYFVLFADYSAMSHFLGKNLSSLCASCKIRVAMNQ
jgi:hypothetical protein